MGACPACWPDEDFGRPVGAVFSTLIDEAVFLQGPDGMLEVDPFFLCDSGTSGTEGASMEEDLSPTALFLLDFGAIPVAFSNSALLS